MFEIDWSTSATIISVVAVIAGTVLKLLSSRKNPLEGNVLKLEREILQIKLEMKGISEKIVSLKREHSTDNQELYQELEKNLNEVKKELEKLGDRYERLVAMVTEWLLNFKTKI
jgi:chromosome segregation ATPase